MSKRKRSTEQEQGKIAVEARFPRISKSRRKQKSEVADERRAEDISSEKVKGKEKEEEKKKKRRILSSKTRHDDQLIHYDPSSRGLNSISQSTSEQEQHQLHGDVLSGITEHADALYAGSSKLDDDKKSDRSIDKITDNTEFSETSKRNGTKRKKVKKKRDKWGQVLSSTQHSLAVDGMLESTEIVTNEHVNGDLRTNQEVSAEYEDKMVCAGGMPYDTSEADIRDFFKDCGVIANVVCMKFADTQRFKGLAFISFKNEAAATKALSLDGVNMGGRFIKIEKARAGGKVLRPPPKREPGSLSVYIGNLNWDVQKADIKRFFKGCDIDDVRLAVDKHTGNLCGYGHVDFSNEKSLERAVKMDQKQLLGRAVKISYAVSKGSKRSANF